MFKFILLKILVPFLVLSLVMFGVLYHAGKAVVNDVKSTYERMTSKVVLESFYVFVRTLEGYELDLEKRIERYLRDLDLVGVNDVETIRETMKRVLNDISIDMLGTTGFVDADYALLTTDGKVVIPGKYAEVDTSPITLDRLKDLEIGQMTFKRLVDVYKIRGSDVFIKVGYLKITGDLVLALRFYMKWTNVDEIMAEIKDVENDFRIIKSVNLYTYDLKPLCGIFDPVPDEVKEYILKAIQEERDMRIETKKGAILIHIERLTTLGPKQFSKPILAVIELDFTYTNTIYSIAMVSFMGMVGLYIILMVFRIENAASFISKLLGDLARSMKKFVETKELENVMDIESGGIEEIDSLIRSFNDMAQTIAAQIEEIEAANELLENSYEELERSYEKLEMAYIGFGKELAMIAEGYDEATGNHITRVGELSAFIAEKMGLGEFFVRRIRYYAPLHDIGKLLVPREILHKPGKLTDEEFEEMKKHTIYGAFLLEDVPGFDMARNIALYHHEKYDESGYPFGISGDRIPIEAQIVGLVDVYDALRSKRPYKEAFSHEKTLKIITEGDERTKPDNFNPEILKIFLEFSDEIEKLWKRVWAKESLLEEKIREYFGRIGGIY